MRKHQEFGGRGGLVIGGEVDAVVTVAVDKEEEAKVGAGIEADEVEIVEVT